MNKQKTIKARLLAMLLLLCMIFSMMPISVFAVDTYATKKVTTVAEITNATYDETLTSSDYTKVDKTNFTGASGDGADWVCYKKDATNLYFFVFQNYEFVTSIDVPISEVTNLVDWSGWFILVAATTHTITYDANGGGGTMTAQTATADPFSLPTCTFTAPEGKQFKEWAIGSVDGTKVATGDVHTFTANTTVYAIWEDAANTAVAFNKVTANGGSTATTTLLTLTFDQVIEGFSADDITLTGATKGTLTKLDGESAQYQLAISDITVAHGQDVTVAIAKTGFTFTPASKTVKVRVVSASYTVTYDANGGGGTMTDATATASPFTLPTCTFTAPEGKQFKEWAIGSVDGTKVASGGTHTFTANTTVYAVWATKSTVKIAGNELLDGAYYKVTTNGTLSVGSDSDYNAYLNSGTLTLNNLSVSDGGIETKVDLTIDIQGNNDLTSNTIAVCHTGYNGTLTFTGTGTLTCTASGDSETLSSNYITVNGGTLVMIAADGNAVQADKNLIVNGGTLKASSTSGNGIIATTITVEGGIVESNSDATDSWGMSTYSAGNIFLNGGTVTSKGANGALRFAPSLGAGVTAKASTNIDGSIIADYVATNNDAYKWFEAKASTPNPTITVGTQTGNLNYHYTSTAPGEDTTTFAVSTSNFETKPVAADYTVKWYTNASGTTGETTTTPIGFTVTKDTDKITIKTSDKAYAGSYYFKLTASNGSETATSEVVAVTINKITVLSQLSVKKQWILW